MTPEQVMADSICGMSQIFTEAMWEVNEKDCPNYCKEMKRKDHDLAIFSTCLSGAKYHASRNDPPIIVGFNIAVFDGEVKAILGQRYNEELAINIMSGFMLLDQQIPILHNNSLHKLRKDLYSKEEYLKDLDFQVDLAFGWAFAVILAKSEGGVMPELHDFSKPSETSLAALNIGQRINGFCKDVWWRRTVDHLRPTTEAE